MRTAASCLLLLAASAAHAQSHTIVDLGPGEATAINSRNEIAGVGATGNATIWRDGVAQDLGAGPIVPTSQAVAINDAGQVAGTFAPGDFECSDGCRGVGHAFLYTPGSIDGIPTNPQMKDLGELTGLRHTQATALNVSGQVAGIAFDDGWNENFHESAFLWTPGATDGDPANPQMKDLGVPAGFIRSAAFGMNDAGEVVGLAWDAAGVVHAIHWHDGIADDLGPGLANSISNGSPRLITGEDEFGAVIWQDGIAQYLNPTDAFAPFLLSPSNSAGEFAGGFSRGPTTGSYAYQGGGWHVLPDLEGNDSMARAINDAGWIVGRAFVPGPWGPEQHAVIWRRPQIDTPVGSNVTVSGSGMTLTFAQVTSAGVTTLASDSSGNATPSGFMSAGIRYDVSTTATYLPPLDVCVTYDPAALAPGAESTLQFLHFQDGAWADVTTSLDTTAKVICGRTQSLSPFTMVAADKIAPTIDIILPDSLPVSSKVQVSYRIRDNSALFLSATATLDGVRVQRNAIVTLSEPGWHVLSVRASDPAGNVAQASQRIFAQPPGPALDVSTALTRLWPPDGRMVDVGLQVSLVDATDPNATFTVQVSSDDGSGSQPQWTYSGGALRLRAQRAGAARGGRTYTVTVTARDAAGYSATKVVTVQVPHDSRN